MSAETPPVNGLVELPDEGSAIVGADPVKQALETLRITWCNVPFDSPMAEIMMLASIGECDLKADDVLNQELHIRAVLIRTVALADKVTGEVTDKPRTIFLLEDGSTLSFISVGILESLAVLASRRPKGEFVPPLHVRMKQIPISNGHRKYVFQPILAPTVNPKPNGGKHGK